MNNRNYGNNNKNEYESSIMGKIKTTNQTVNMSC